MGSKTKIEKLALEQRKKSMSKKAFEEYQKAQRVCVGFNTGTRTHKSKKDYNRQASKLEAKRMAI